MWRQLAHKVFVVKCYLKHLQLPDLSLMQLEMTPLRIPLLCKLFHSPGLCKGLFLAVRRGDDKKNPINFFPQSWPKNPGPVCVNIAQFWRKHLIFYELVSRCFSKGWEWAYDNTEYHPRILPNKWLTHLLHAIHPNIEIKIKIKIAWGKITF